VPVRSTTSELFSFGRIFLGLQRFFTGVLDEILGYGGIPSSIGDWEASTFGVGVECRKGRLTECTSLSEVCSCDGNDA